MKTRLQKFLITCILLTTTFVAVKGQSEQRAGYLPIDETLDMSTVAPKVNIHLPKFMLNETLDGLDEESAAAFDKIGVDLQQLINDINRIRILVFEVNDTNRESLQNAITTLQKELDKSWIPLVKVPEENVNIYTISDASGNRMGGLALLIMNGGNAVIINIDGRVPIGSLLKLAAKSNALPENLLGQLAQATGQTDTTSESESKEALKDE